jgi:hypothetical protein
MPSRLSGVIVEQARLAQRNSITSTSSAVSTKRQTHRPRGTPCHQVGESTPDSTEPPQHQQDHDDAPSELAGASSKGIGRSADGSTEDGSGDSNPNGMRAADRQHSRSRLIRTTSISRLVSRSIPGILQGKTGPRPIWPAGWWADIDRGEPLLLLQHDFPLPG